RRHSDSYGLLVMDLDHFKQINDRFGHHVGDQVLVAFVELIKRYCRKDDRLFRFGGEEFLLLLPSTDAEGLRAAAQHLLNKVATDLKSAGGEVTVSSGGVVLHGGEHWERWLERAYGCMYGDKGEGRNRPVTAGAPCV